MHGKFNLRRHRGLQPEKVCIIWNSTGDWGMKWRTSPARACAVRALLPSRRFCSRCPLSQASAQQMNGFINLMGQMIQHDMQERAYKRQLQQQQQMRAEQERQQQLELRRQQIALIKRLQTALSKLGFYKSAIDGDAGPGTRAAERKFSAAFDVGQISLTEHDVAAVESYAAAGFRSKDEIIRARRGGFQTRDELLAAEAGGFSNELDFHAAQQLGFNSYDAYNAYRLSGFDSVADFWAHAKEVSPILRATVRRRRLDFQAGRPLRSSSALGFQTGHPLKSIWPRKRR